MYLPAVLRGAIGPKQLVNGDFESGRTGWTEYSAKGAELIYQATDLPISPHGGTWAAWLGGLLDETSHIEQQVTVSARSPYLSYWHWIGSQDSCGHDFAGVLIDGATVVDQYDLCESKKTGGWAKHVVDLSAYAGQSISIRIRVETNSSNNSNLFVDDIAFQSSLSSAQEDGPLYDPGQASPKTGGSSPGDAGKEGATAPKPGLVHR